MQGRILQLQMMLTLACLLPHQAAWAQADGQGGPSAAFEVAAQIDTVEEYTRFLKLHPDSDYASLARAALVRLTLREKRPVLLTSLAMEGIPEDLLTKVMRFPPPEGATSLEEEDWLPTMGFPKEDDFRVIDLVLVLANNDEVMLAETSWDPKLGTIVLSLASDDGFRLTLIIDVSSSIALTSGMIFQDSTVEPSESSDPESVNEGMWLLLGYVFEAAYDKILSAYGEE